MVDETYDNLFIPSSTFYHHHTIYLPIYQSVWRRGGVDRTLPISVAILPPRAVPQSGRKTCVLHLSHRTQQSALHNGYDDDSDDDGW